jgi:hypothetical protein
MRVVAIVTIRPIGRPHGANCTNAKGDFLKGTSKNANRD